MELKLQQLVVSGTAYRKPKDRLESYYIIMQIEQRKGWKIRWLIRGCSLIIPPMISKFRANFSARNFHVIRRGAGTDTEKALFPFIFLRNGTSIYTSRKKELSGALGTFWRGCICACFTLNCFFYSSTSNTSVRADFRPTYSSSMVTKLRHRQRRCRQQQ